MIIILIFKLHYLSSESLSKLNNNQVCVEVSAKRMKHLHQRNSLKLRIENKGNDFQMITHSTVVTVTNSDFGHGKNGLLRGNAIFSIHC